MFNKKAQTTFEYAIVLGLIVLALGMMQVYFRRGLQGGYKFIFDDLGRQEDSQELDPTKGTKPQAKLHSKSDTIRTIAHSLGGDQTIDFKEETNTTGSSEYWSDWEEK